MENSQFTTLSEILANEVSGSTFQPSRAAFARAQQVKAEREWYGAILALNTLLEQQVNLVDRLQTNQGIILSGPSPILTSSALMIRFASQVFVPDSTLGQEPLLLHLQRLHPRLLPGSAGTIQGVPTLAAFPLCTNDPLAQEPFCMALTAHFSLIMVLGKVGGSQPAFLFSFDPDVVSQGLELLQGRVGLFSSGFSMEQFRQAAGLDDLLEQFPPIAPTYQVVTQFSRLVLQNLPTEFEPHWELSGEKTVRQRSPTAQPRVQELARITPAISNPEDISEPQAAIRVAELELLQAIAHEVRTPLATIRTLARLLLNRQHDPETIQKYVKKIDQECTTQIDRSNFIFRAAELELSQSSGPGTQKSNDQFLKLTPMSLLDVFQNSLPRWQHQAHQRNHTLEVDLPQKLPTVISDPALLDQVLTGVIENFTRSLPSGSHIQVGVSLAGHQLKLQLESQPCQGAQATAAVPRTPLKSLGPLLMFQPETGMLSLNLSVTKNLFQALGGKLVVRQRPQQGKVMTIFLPLKNS
ncbi:MAG: sensor histidine kinase [Microcoleaceae cyanobacterium]